MPDKSYILSRNPPPPEEDTGGLTQQGLVFTWWCLAIPLGVLIIGVLLGVLK